MKRCVVTGIGTVSTIGNSTDSFWEACLSGTTNIAPVPEDWGRYWSMRSKLWSPLTLPDYKNLGFKSADLFQFDPVTLNALVATREALERALLSTELSDDGRSQIIKDTDSDRIGVFFGTGIGGASSLLENHSNHTLSPLKKQIVTLLNSLDGAENADIKSWLLRELDHFNIARVNPLTLVRTMINAVAAAVANRYAIHGPVSVSCVACASGTVAIGRAFNSIASGEIDVAISGGSEYWDEVSGAFFRSFDELRTLTSHEDDPSRANRPFDQNRSGFLFNQGGAASLVLEEYEHAKSRGAPILAEIIGYAESFDAHNMVSIQPEGIQIEKMLRKLLATACVTASDVDYINAHGTGTQINDETESKIIENIFGNIPAVNSSKSILGHSIGVSGAYEAAITALSISQQKLHASLNIDSPVRDLNFVRTTREQAVNVAISQSFAFGGHNAALLFKAV